MKKKVARWILIVLLVGIVLGLGIYAFNKMNPTSLLDSQIVKLLDGECDGEAAAKPFSENSAERFLIKGIASFEGGNMEEADQYFNTAKEKKYRDSTFPVYLGIYQNRCNLVLTGVPDAEAVKKILDEMMECTELSSPAYWVWDLVYPFTGADDEGAAAKGMLKDYLDKAQNLTTEQRIQLESYQAILKNITGEYSESIMLFYDILDKTKDEPETPAIITAQSVSINYIAEMYNTFEDYEKAEELYLNLAEKNFENPQEGAQYKYMAYLNLANIYLEQKDYEQAKKMVEEIEAIKSYFDEVTISEIEAFLSNILANVELSQGNIDKAKEYYKVCTDFLVNNENSTFFDTEAYFKLTESNILIKEKKLEEAEKVLTDFLGEKSIIESNMVYKVRSRLIDVYRMSGQNAKHYSELKQLVKEQNIKIEQCQTAYCEAIDYYEQLLTLQKKHKVSVQRNEVMAVVIVIAVILLVLIWRISLKRYKDSVTDTLSGLYNRKQLEKEIAHYEKNKHKFMSYGIIMMDIDYFKRYNDIYGHAAGDEIISRIADVVKQSVGKKGCVIRYGGEEFLILLQNINSTTIESIAERIRVNVQKEKIIHSGSECSEYVSLSLGGIYVEDTKSVDLEEAIKEADKALYESKENGRNRVTMRE